MALLGHPTHLAISAQQVIMDISYHSFQLDILWHDSVEYLLRVFWDLLLLPSKPSITVLVQLSNAK